MTVTARLNLIGLFRSGTNYTRSILEWNYDVAVFYDAFGWKHAPVPTFTAASPYEYPQDKLLVVVKNPYSTLRSWYKYVTQNGRNIRAATGSFAEFLSRPIVFFDENNKDVAPEYYYQNPIQMWNAVVWNHVSVAERLNGVVIDYDRMLAEPETVCGLLAGKLGLVRKSEEFSEPEQVVLNMNDRTRPKDAAKYTTGRKFDKSYFEQKKYLDDYMQSDLDLVGQGMDDALLVRLNRALLQPVDYSALRVAAV